MKQIKTSQPQLNIKSYLYLINEMLNAAKFM